MERTVQANIIEREAVSARIEVQVPESEVQKAYAGIYRSLAQQVRVDGFRPGKAPRRVLEARVGKENIDEEVREVLIKHFYPRAVQDLGLQPVHAAVEDGDHPVEGEAYRFEVALELYPQVTLADVNEIVIDAEVPTLTQAQYEEAVEGIRRDRATLVPVDRSIEPGDYLSVESLSENGEATGNIMPLDLENVGDLAEGFIGKSVGDTVALKIPHNHPLEEDDDPEEHVTVLKVRVLDVKAKEKPELDDDLAKTLGFESWDEAERQIRENLQARLDAQGFEEQQEEFIDKLVETSEVDLPKSLVARQQEILQTRLDEDLKQRGGNLEAYLSSLDAEAQAAFHADILEGAQKRTKRDLVLERLREVRGTELSESDFRRALEVLAESRRSNVAQLRKELGNEGLSNYRHLLMRDKAVREAVKERLGDAAPAAAPRKAEAADDAAPADEA